MILYEFQRHGYGKINATGTENAGRNAAKKNELDKKTFEFSVGGGAVTLLLNGAYELISIKISDELMKSGDVEMLQDLVLSAFNGAVKQVKAASESSFGSLDNLKNFF